MAPTSDRNISAKQSSRYLQAPYVRVLTDYEEQTKHIAKHTRKDISSETLYGLPTSGAETAFVPGRLRDDLR